MSVDHYENFPVASFLCPPALRPAVQAIYHYARTADDIADEGDAPPTQRLAELSAYRADLHRVANGEPPSARWVKVFLPLADAIARHRLPLALLSDLLSAFEQDVMKHRYADREELLAYCRLSANPVGRLLLHLYDVRDAIALRQSDAVCTALQLINFWQDLGIDLPRDRLYLPLDRCKAHGLTEAALFERVDTDATRALVREQCDWAVALMHEGAPLVKRVPGRAGWELRGVVQGGLRIAEKIAELGHATLNQRPTLRSTDLARMAWRAWRMR